MSRVQNSLQHGILISEGQRTTEQCSPTQTNQIRHMHILVNMSIQQEFSDSLRRWKNNGRVSYKPSVRQREQKRYGTLTITILL